MKKKRYERLKRVVSNYDILVNENKIINKETQRKNGRLSCNGRYIAVNGKHGGL